MVTFVLKLVQLHYTQMHNSEYYELYRKKKKKKNWSKAIGKRVHYPNYIIQYYPSIRTVTLMAAHIPTLCIGFPVLLLFSHTRYLTFHFLLSLYSPPIWFFASRTCLDGAGAVGRPLCGTEVHVTVMCTHCLRPTHSHTLPLARLLHWFL